MYNSNIRRFLLRSTWSAALIGIVEAQHLHLLLWLAPLSRYSARNICVQRLFMAFGGPVLSVPALWLGTLRCA